MKLSEHFSLGELTKTNFQTPDNNEPPLEAVENMMYELHFLEDYDTSQNVEGIVINQGYRSLQVSEAMEKAGLHPAKHSNHQTGCAVDIRCSGKEQAIRYLTILLDIADENKKD